MILDKIDGLSNNSHKRVDVECDFKESELCKDTWNIEYRQARRTLDENDNKIICLNCSRKIKSSGRNNPNCKYITVDDNWFENINSPEKALCLGWMASDGSLHDNIVNLGLHTRDINELAFIRDLICKEIPITFYKNDNGSTMAEFTISSKKMMSDCCNYLGIKPGKKDKNIRLPNIDKSLIYYFLCGYFNGDGTINKVGSSKSQPVCSIASNSTEMLRDIQKNVPMKSYLCSEPGKSQTLEFDGVNALDFLGKIYEIKEFALLRKYNRFIEWCSWSPSLREPGTGDNTIRFTRTRKNAVRPSKNNISDSGYDLTITEMVKTIGEVNFYGTGIKVRPADGYYFQLVPRSSISKTGYIMANSIGIIDRSFIGEILVPLIKIDKNAPELSLPCKIAQLVPTQIQHFEIQEVDELVETSRGELGFGSSGR